MKLVQEGKLSPEDAAELIDAFSTTEPQAPAGGPPPSPPPDAGAEPRVETGRDPFKSFVDGMERMGKEIREINWNDVAKQVRESTTKGVESLKAGVEKIKSSSKWGWGEQESREVILPLSVPEGKTLRIENSSGDVKIVHTDNPGSIRASATFRGSDHDDAQDKAERYTLVLEESDSVVLVRQPDMSGLSVDLHIELSEKCAVSVHSDSGDISIADSGGKCKVTNRSGDVKLSGLDGPIDVSMQKGDLVVEDCKAPSVSIEGKSGDLTFRRVKGNLNVRTANGDIRVQDCDCKTVSLESVSGDVSVHLDEPVKGTVNIRTVNG